MREGRDPHTGKFTKGNPGRRKGSKNTRTLQWEELGKEITEANTAKFNALLDRLWNSPDLNDQLRAAELFLKVAEFFKPKLQRIQTPDLPGVPLPAPQIIITRQIIGRDGKITEEREP